MPVTRVLNETEYKEELEKKLLEEYKEVLEATGSDRVEELADMFEVIRALGRLENATMEQIIEIADKKNNKRGSFNDKIFLEKVLVKGKKR